MTVVVPAYGDVESLLACVRSLIETVDQSIDSVLIVNDCGPEAETVERELLMMIDGQPGFRYERNLTNLGFVGNCNRAVFELDRTENDILLLNSDSVVTPGFLDEMSFVLHANPSHGVVCPRSNNATIASIPHRLSASRGRTVERTTHVHSALRELLPRFTISPVAMGFCFLVRRDLIRRFGFFDDIFSPGYGEENDFCLRINKFGYSSIIANRALVFHVGGRSFLDERRVELRASHGRILDERYPHYSSSVRHYLAVDIDPIDHFADVVIPADEIAHVLIDVLDGDLDQEVRALLARARQISRDRAHFTLAIPEEARERLAAEFRGITVVAHDQVSGIFDLAYFTGRKWSMCQLQRANATALRWATSINAAVDQRRWEEAMASPHERLSQRVAMKYADAVFATTAEILDDARMYYHQGDEGATLVQADFTDAQFVVEQLLQFSKSPIDIDALRRRWILCGDLRASAAGVEAASRTGKGTTEVASAANRAVRARRSVGALLRRVRSQ